MFRHGLIDYLEVLRMAGLEDWGPFKPHTGSFFTSATVPSPTAAGPPVLPPENTQPVSLEPAPPIPQSEPPGDPVIPVPIAPVSSSMPKKTHAVATSREHAPPDAQAALDLVAAEVTRCRRCVELVANRTQTVFGTGSPLARLVFIGEAPGADEDKQGVPFVGRAGQLLTDMITKGMGLAREDVYICNILRCRPPGNRNPTPDEAQRCRGFLDRTLEIVAPNFICCLGAIAARNLLQTEEAIGKLRGRIHDYHGVQVVCTYHPAYLLRNPAAKKDTWADLQLLMKIMGLPIPKK